MVISVGCLPYIVLSEDFIQKTSVRGHPEDIRKTSIGPHPEDIRNTSGRPPEITGEGEIRAQSSLGNLRIENKARGVTGQGGNPDVEPG